MADFASGTYRFHDFELDADRFELRCGGQRVHVEPQVLSLLLLLAENRDRMVGKDEVIDRIWDGRIVSESAVAARIKAARKAVGDDGSAQGVIRTIHGKGFRFVAPVAEVRAKPAPAPAPAMAAIQQQASTTPPPLPLPPRDGRPSIAVLPFQLLGEPGPHDIVADALPADIITDLARLPWLFVIARGSSFRLRGPDCDPLRAGRELGVRYCLTGTVELSGRAVTISTALVDAGDGGTIWADQFRGALDDLQQLRPEIEAHVVGSLEVQIQQHEVRLARGRPAADLDAWASFHLGLDHMFRFTRADNAQAALLFTQSLDRDPWFARALGGLSFTHFQNAFLRFEGDPAAEMDAARDLAHRAVEADRLDPFAYFNIGRCFWLDGELDDAIAWFDRALNLSPSFAQGVYNRGLVGVMAGKVGQADADLALALDLSPLDPLAYAMVSGRALAQLQLGELDRAAELGATAARMPGAHKHIILIAAVTAHLAGRDAEARTWLARARRADPDLSAEVFFTAFPFAGTAAREVIARGMRDLGL